VKGRKLFLYLLAAFASFETLLAVVGALATPSWGPALTALTTTRSGPTNPFVFYAPPLSIAGWIAVGLVVFQGRASRHSQIKSLFARKGFGGDVYDLMIGMRGGGSRVSLLQNMESPKHRHELSELTGIDWKEVDRQLAVLEKYGLVKVYAQSGSVKLYQVTEQGKLLLGLIAELNDKTA
jgi:DNA-binding transcriptional ArsR family regulator